jgi:DNA-binding NarL/FixJ family response regulator
MERIRTLLVDDHQIMCQGVRLLLEREPDFLVLAEEAHDGREAIELARAHSPDAVVMDLNMPGLNGIEATRRIVHDSPGTRVIALTGHTDARRVCEALEAGASGYVVKDAAAQELIGAIRAAVAGQTYLSPRISGQVEWVSANGNGHHAAAGPGPGVRPVVPRDSAFERLSAREREVLQLTAEGKATKQIAQCMGVSLKTAETHRRSVMHKLGMQSIAELTKYAIRVGLTTIDDAREPDA